MMHEEVAKYRELSGDTNPNTPISRIGGYLDGYEKALEQEACEDAVSRQAVLDLIEHYNSDGLGSVFFGYKQGVKFADAVNKLPSVKPQYTDAVGIDKES